MAGSRRNPGSPGSRPVERVGRVRMPPVRLVAREDLAAAARVAPLLRAARDLARWAIGRSGPRQAGPSAAGPAAGPATTGLPGAMSAADLAAAADALDLAPREVETACQVALAAGMFEPATGGPGRPGPADLASAGPEEILAIWDRALTAILAAEELDGLVTALYTAGGPVRMDGLFEAYAAAAGSGRRRPATATAGSGSDQTAVLSQALETLADLAVVEPGADESGGGLTVELSPLGVWGVHRRLQSQGWHVPVLGTAERAGAAGLLGMLAACDAEDGEAEISSWLEPRDPASAAAELIEAAAVGSPGLRSAAFAVLGRIGTAAVPAARAALADPALRAHAAVWLHEHGEEAELAPEDRAWLLVDLGAGLLEEADPRDVAVELLPELPAEAQAEIVAGLWRVSHPGVTDLLTTLSDHHPSPAVARAARKAAFKARSPAAEGEGTPGRAAR